MEPKENTPEYAVAIPEFLYWIVAIILVILLIYLLIGLYFVIRTLLDSLAQRLHRRVYTTAHLFESELESGLHNDQKITETLKIENPTQTRIVKFKNEVASSFEASRNKTQSALKQMFEGNNETNTKKLLTYTDANQNVVLDENFNPIDSEGVNANASFMAYVVAADPVGEDGDDDDDNDDDEEDTETEAEDDDEIPGDDGEIQGDDGEIPGDEGEIPGDDGEIPGDDGEIPSDGEIPEPVDVEDRKESLAQEVSQNLIPEKPVEEIDTEIQIDEDNEDEIIANAFPVSDENLEVIKEESVQDDNCEPSDSPTILGPHFTLNPYLQPVQDLITTIVMSAPESASDMLVEIDPNTNPAPEEYVTEAYNADEQTAIRSELDRLTSPPSCGIITLLDFMQAEGSDWRYESGEANRDDPKKRKKSTGGKRKCSSEIPKKMKKVSLAANNINTPEIYVVKIDKGSIDMEKMEKSRESVGTKSTESVRRGSEKSEHNSPKISDVDERNNSIESKNEDDEEKNEDDEEEKNEDDEEEKNEDDEEEKNEDDEEEETEDVEEETEDVEEETDDLKGVLSDDATQTLGNKEILDDHGEFIKYPSVEDVNTSDQKRKSIVRRNPPAVDKDVLKTNADFPNGTGSVAVQPCPCGPATITINLNIQSSQPCETSRYPNPDCRACDKLFADHRTPYPESNVDCACNPCECDPPINKFNEEDNLDICKSFGAITFLDYMQAEGSAFGHDHKHGQQTNTIGQIKNQIASWWESAMKSNDNANINANVQRPPGLVLSDADCSNLTDEIDTFTRVSKMKVNERKKSEKEYLEIQKKSSIECEAPVSNEYMQQVIRMSKEENKRGRKVCRTEGQDEQVRSNYERDFNSPNGRK